MRPKRVCLQLTCLPDGCDIENPANFDQVLADTFYKAGFDLAIELSVLCESMERFIRVSEEEPANVIRLR